MTIHRWLLVTVVAAVTVLAMLASTASASTQCGSLGFAPQNSL